MAVSQTTLNGYNSTFQYTAGSDVSVFNARVSKFGHSFAVIATESHARQHRAMYPHQRAEGPFSVTLELKHYTEFRAFMDFMRSFMSALMASQNRPMPLMSVSIPTRNFWRLGVPINGVSDGDHIGSNLFQPSISFESVVDPLDPTVATGYNNVGSFSQFDPGGSGADSAGQFFYPSTGLTNDPNAQGESIYDAPPIGTNPIGGGTTTRSPSGGGRQAY
jgi:hypothetical protein